MSDPSTASTFDGLRRRIARTLKVAFADDERSATVGLDARLIVAHAADLDPDELIMRGDQRPSLAIETAATELADRRAAGTPVARLTGHIEFFGLDLELSDATLVPRPDSETVVEAALAALPLGDQDGLPSVLDLGTGAGGLLLALASAVPGLRGLGIDLSPEAVATAVANATRLGLDDRVRFAVGNWAEAVNERFDIVVANPPYIETAAISMLQPEVRNHEPGRALDGGPDGLAAYRMIVPDLERLLSIGGRGFLEIGHQQAAAVCRLADKYRFKSRVIRDLAGRDRVIEISAAARP